MFWPRGQSGYRNGGSIRRCVCQQPQFKSTQLEMPYLSSNSSAFFRKHFLHFLHANILRERTILALPTDSVQGWQETNHFHGLEQWMGLFFLVAFGAIEPFLACTHRMG